MVKTGLFVSMLAGVKEIFRLVRDAPIHQTLLFPFCFRCCRLSLRFTLQSWGRFQAPQKQVQKIPLGENYSSKLADSLTNAVARIAYIASDVILSVQPSLGTESEYSHHLTRFAL